MSTPPLKRILVVIPWFGQWPDWMRFFLASCRANSTIDWALIGDCAPLADLPPNVRHIQTSFEAYRDHVSTPARVVPEGEYYVLGDHRSSSNDSRMWGTVPRHYIYGKAAFVYWPLDRMGLLR